MLKRLGEVLRGERSLAETYWIWFILPQIPILILILLVSANSITLVVYSQALFFSLLYGVLILGFLILLASGFAVFQSAFKSSKTRFWSAVAMIIVAGNIIYGGVRIPGVLLGTAAPSTSEMQQQLAMLNAQLPQRIDAVTSLTHVDLDGKTMTYSFVLDESIAHKVNASSMRALARPKVCQAFAAALAQKELSKIIYAYSSASEKLFQFEIEASDCP